MKISIYRAGDTFFYLPLYIAYELGIFKRFLQNVDVEFVTNSTFIGDLAAIKKIVENTPKDVIPIAIADPTCFLWENITVEKEDRKSKIKVIGGLINKPPFWAIDHQATPFGSREELETKFKSKTLIFPKKKYATVYAIGHELSANIHDSPEESENKTIECEFGEEFTTLNARPQNKSDEYLVLSGDILTIAKAMESDSTLLTQFCFAKMKENDGTSKEYAVTGILANKDDIEKSSNKEIFINFLNAIQAALYILKSCESSELINILFNVTNNIDKKIYACDDLSNWAKIKVFELIQQGNFYPFDLSISNKAWGNSIKNLQIVDFARYNKMEHLLNNSYNDYTYFDFLQSLAFNTMGAGVSQNGQRITELEADITQKEQKITNLEADVSQKEQKITKLETDITQKAEQITKLAREAKFSLCHIRSFFCSVGKRLKTFVKDQKLFWVVMLASCIITGVVAYILHNKSHDWGDLSSISIELATFFGIPAFVAMYNKSPKMTTPNAKQSD